CCYLLNEYIQSMIVFKRLPIFYPNLDLELNSDNSKAYFEDWIQKAHFVLMRSDNGSDFPNISQCLIGESVDKIDVCIKLFKKKYISQFELVKKIFISDEHEKTALLIYKKINGSQAHLN
ncbi:MAG: hypothetical protein KKH94_10645, partial [Candidatus Omnitrophica bacterium]|nr:hypothetical protein [Candidatus Omnitrophota bacterium]